MNAETLYRKVGRRYVPVAEYERFDALPAGTYLVVITPGSRRLTSVVDPDLAGFLAAAETAREGMLSAITEAGRMAPRSREYTATERRGWAAYKAIAGEPSTLILEGKSAWDIVQAGLDAVRAEYERTRGGRT